MNEKCIRSETRLARESTRSDFGVIQSEPGVTVVML